GGSGATCLARCPARPPDFILSDLAIPALDGLYLRAELRRVGYGDISVLVMSAHQRPATVPAKAFLAKPFDLATLLAGGQTTTISVLVVLRPAMPWIGLRTRWPMALTSSP